ncbi:MAG: DNA mismatch repair protein MutS [Firmicutes bacterium]|jgi:DNA mismatch repair protein MutS|nr:DNA mismatch repair protein MutS [Bacillota bacterium]
MKLSPMMEQYMEIKNNYKDCILFFRLGDFYEMFFDDAILASKELELTLTGKNCGQEERAPMCGVPFHSAESYIAKLVEKGYKVAICEQIEEPSAAKGIVKREVIQIVTPGTVTAQSMLAEKENNYLAVIYLDEKDRGMSIAYCDVSTGEVNVTESSGDDIYETLINELVKIKAREIIVTQSFSEKYSTEEIALITEAYINIVSDDFLSRKACLEAVKAQFNCISTVSLGLEEDSLAVLSLGALISYLLETQKHSLKHLTGFNFYEMGKHMSLDKATLRNLELTETLHDKKVSGSLLGVLDKTHTAMGSRKMKQWLREPLNDVYEINLRLDGVEELYGQIILRNNIKESLKGIYDFERLAGRIACGNANGKDLIALKNSVSLLPEIKETLSYANSEILKKLNSEINPLNEVYTIIENSICDEPPFSIKDGGLIKENYSKELDELKDSIKDGKSWISNLESSERERTGIKNLKVGYNRVFGYYLEVTRSYFDLIPENYIRKQTLANAERFITPELKEMENLVLNAENKINQMEHDIFVSVRKHIETYIKEIQKTSLSIAQLDVLCSFAQVSEKLGYVKPVIDNSMEIQILKGKHPVIEQTVSGGLFISNDTYVNDSDSSMLLITGPNMAGKSTYMRQTALLVLMAQAGCFIPCESAHIGVVDRIFTRIGASDNLAQGQSTFYVEMSELSYILNSASPRSLIILDEIGRGTSTYDGLSIAWAAVEYLCNEKTHIRTLFATHYHELTVLEEQISGVKNLNVDVSEVDGNIVFLHKIVEGSASRSYGIHVAKLAGIPSKLLERAREKLYELETGKSDYNNKTANIATVEEQQISFFTSKPNPAVERLKSINLMDVTPSQAIKILEELKDSIDD